jgi:hypothetical protein
MQTLKIEEGTYFTQVSPFTLDSNQTALAEVGVILDISAIPWLLKFAECLNDTPLNDRDRFSRLSLAQKDQPHYALLSALAHTSLIDS